MLRWLVEPRSKILLLASVVLTVLFVVSCAPGLSPDFQTPSVTVTSFRSLPAVGLSPRFEIGLHIVNPNAQELRLRGMSYRIFLNQREVVSGASNELPVVQGYGEADVDVVAVVSLIDTLGVANDLMQNPTRPVDYRVAVKLDAGVLWPAIRIEESGYIGGISGASAGT